MKLYPRVMTAAAVFAFTCVVTAAAYYYKKRASEINEVMIFCKLQYNPHDISDKILSYLESAKRSINVCMPDIKNPAIQGILLKAMKTKKIKAKIIIEQSSVNSGSEILIEELKEAGADIKYKTEKCGMRYKFCLIDDKILMTGTLDWGEGNNLSDNYDYVYVTNKPQLVQPVKEEFDKMWQEFPNWPDSQSTHNDNLVNECFPADEEFQPVLKNEIPKTIHKLGNEMLSVLNTNILTNQGLIECTS